MTWTLDQATELVFEQVVTLLDGCPDEDLVRPQIVLDAIRDAWSPGADSALPEDMTAGELRTACRRGRLALVPVNEETAE